MKNCQFRAHELQFPPEFNQELVSMAEGVGFEPTDPCGSPVFKTGALNRSAIPPVLTGFNLPPASLWQHLASKL